MVAKPFDLEANHPLYPRREILAEYAKINTEDNKFEYELTGQDRVYKEWYYLAKDRPVKQQVTQIYRKKIPGEGEFLIYNFDLIGQDWKGNKKTFSTLWGRYEKPIFVLEKNPETQKTTAQQIADHQTVYDVPFTKEKLEELIDMGTEPISMIVYGSAGRRLGVTSLDDYREGTIEDLIMCANKGKSLQTVLAEKGQFTYEKREQKQVKAKLDS